MLFLSEEEADREVIQTLFSEIKKMKGSQMPILKTVEGKIYRVHTDELQEITVEDVQAEITHFEDVLTKLRALLPAPEQPAPTAPQPAADAPQAPTPEAPPAPTPEAPAAPVMPEVPAPPAADPAQQLSAPPEAPLNLQ